MHVQVVTYRLAESVSDDEFIDANQEFAEAMAAVPGLLSKVWLKGDEANVYGGIYLWEDRAACQEFLSGELWAEVVNDRSLVDLTSKDFAVMDSLTRSTQPRMQLISN